MHWYTRHKKLNTILNEKRENIERKICGENEQQNLLHISVFETFVFQKLGMEKCTVKNLSSTFHMFQINSSFSDYTEFKKFNICPDYK